MFKNSLVFLIVIKFIFSSTGATETETTTTPRPSCLNLTKATFGLAQDNWNYANEAKWATSTLPNLW